VNDNVDPRTGVHRVRKKKGAQRGSAAGNDSQDRSNAATNGAYLPTYVDENGIPRFAAGQPGVYYDPNNPDVPLVAADGVRYPDVDDAELEPEVDEHGNPNWRSIWLNELARLQQVTHAQDTAGADQEWYKMMVMRVRSAFLVPPPSAGYVEQAATEQPPQQATEAAPAPEGTDPAMA
jgi:forkhead box protein J2/3